jgi:hypothetical protein
LESSVRVEGDGEQAGPVAGETVQATVNDRPASAAALLKTTGTMVVWPCARVMLDWEGSGETVGGPTMVIPTGPAALVKPVVVSRISALIDHVGLLMLVYVCGKAKLACPVVSAVPLTVEEEFPPSPQATVICSESLAGALQATEAVIATPVCPDAGALSLHMGGAFVVIVMLTDSDF